MTRMIRGSVVLAACVGVLSCTGGDPTSGSPGVPNNIVALPAVVFVNQGETQLIGFQLIDDNGGQIPSSWSIGATPPEFSVAIDSGFRPVYNSDGSLTLPAEQTEIRATITGIGSGATEFTVSASGKSLTIPVYVVPTTLSATATPGAAVLLDTVTVTVPAGFTILADAVFGTGTEFPAWVYSVAPDGSSAQIVVPPGSFENLFIDGVEVDFLPGTRLSLPTTALVTRPAQDSRTSPVMLGLPSAGNTLTFIDAPGDGSDTYYGFTANGTDQIRLTVAWEGGADIDILWQNPAGGFVGNFSGATGANPEVSTVLLPAGDYTFDLNVYDAHDDPASHYTITIENLGP